MPTNKIPFKPRNIIKKRNYTYEIFQVIRAQMGEGIKLFDIPFEAVAEEMNERFPEKKKLTKKAWLDYRCMYRRAYYPRRPYPGFVKDAYP